MPTVCMVVSTVCLQAIDDARWAALRRGWERANRSGTESDAQEGDDDDDGDNEEALQMMREMEEEEERRQEEERLAWLAEREKSKAGGGGGLAAAAAPVSTPGSPLPPNPLPTAEDTEQVRNPARFASAGSRFSEFDVVWGGWIWFRGRHVVASTI